MEPVPDRYHVAVEASKLHISRTRRVIDASRSQIVSMTALIEDSRKLLAKIRGGSGPAGRDLSAD